jgi:hypothetical protein
MEKSYAKAICNYKNRNVWPRGTGKTTLIQPVL